jgi:hypothetical protein
VTSSGVPFGSVAAPTPSVTLVVGTSRDAAEVVAVGKLLWLHETRRMPLSSRSNFKVAGELFVVLGDGQRETPRVRIRHPLSVRLRLLRTRPAMVSIIQTYFSAHRDFPFPTLPSDGRGGGRLTTCQSSKVSKTVNSSPALLSNRRFVDSSACRLKQRRARLQWRGLNDATEKVSVLDTLLD